MRWRWRALVGVALAAPVVVVAVLAWPDDRGGVDGPEPFRGRATAEVEVDGETFLVHVSPDRGGGFCVEIETATGGTGSCMPNLADASTLFADGDTWIAAGIAPKDAESVVLLVDEETRVEGRFLDLGDREERLYFGHVEDAASQPRVEILDADGEVLLSR